MLRELQCWRNARLVALRENSPRPGIVDDAAVVVRDGRIVFAGPWESSGLTDGDATQVIDCGGRLITPALIDCHTHLVFGGNRAREFEQRLEGSTYEQIARAGGGILSTVRDTNALSEDELVAQALPRLDTLLAGGVGTVEIKSGYGLNIDAELKMLRAARRLETLRRVRVRTSYLAAHATPPEYAGRNGDYLTDVALPGLELAHTQGLVDAVDGFCERIAFSPGEIRRVFDRARSLGLPVKLHAEQLSNLGGATLAASFRALSADHLEYLDADGAAALARAGTVAVLLPGAFYSLRERQPPPVQVLRDAGARIALATDCNPGTSPLTSLLLAMNMAATLFGLTVPECLAGVTRVAAHALGLSEETGTLEPGKSADFAVWNVEQPAELVYHIGFNPLHARIHRGVAREHMSIFLQPGSVSLSVLENVYRTGAPARLDPACDAPMAAGAARIAEIALGQQPVYGINTGFGKLASIRIHAADVAMLQRNLILSHCCGVGAPMGEDIVRLMMTLKLISLGRGASGVRLEIIRLIEAMLACGVIPVIPEKGSVGASGDLAPLAHLSAVMMGEGEAIVAGQRMDGRAALGRAGLEPVVFAAKEGLALINGTQASTALALAGLFRAHRATQAALVTGALSTDAAMGSPAPFRAEIHALRGHRGQIDTAAALRRLLEGSAIRESHRQGDERVQDPYCIRCQSQVDGACLDVLRAVARTLEIEANAVTDNPLLLSDGSVISGGNFHAEPVALAADQIALAVCEVGAIAQRRIALLVDPSLSYGLPPFLTRRPGLNSGFMIAEVTSAALMSENKQMSHPASVDSTPTSANQEDHVSMSCHGARRLLAMTENLFAIIGIEALTAAQGVELRAPLTTSPQLGCILAVIRAAVPPLEDDRCMAPDLQAAAGLVAAGVLADAVAPGILPGLEGHA